MQIKNQEIQMLIMGIAFIIGGIIFKNAPLDFYKSYDYIKDDERAVRRLKVISCILGYVFLVVGILIVIIEILSILSKLS